MKTSLGRVLLFLSDESASSDVPASEETEQSFLKFKHQNAL